MSPQVIASSIDAAVIQDKPIPQRHATVYHPVVSSMLLANNMRDCVEVKDMYNQCMTTGKEDPSFMCRTAERYHDMCLKGHRL